MATLSCGIRRTYSSRTASTAWPFHRTFATLSVAADIMLRLSSDSITSASENAGFRRPLRPLPRAVPDRRRLRGDALDGSWLKPADSMNRLNAPTIELEFESLINTSPRKGPSRHLRRYARSTAMSTIVSSLSRMWVEYPRPSRHVRLAIRRKSRPKLAAPPSVYEPFKADAVTNSPEA